MKWEYQAEVRLNAFLQHYLKLRLYNGQPDIRAIVFGNDMDMALQLLKISAGNFAGNGSYPKVPSLHPMACLSALAQFPYNLYGIFLCLLALGLLVFLLMRMGVDRNGEVFDKERNLNYSLKGTYGTSGFMTPDEMYWN